MLLRQTISQPYTVAFQTSLLEVKKRAKILEIGTGCGYQTAVLCELEARVFTIERQHALFRKADRGHKKRYIQEQLNNREVEQKVRFGSEEKRTKCE